MQELLVYEYAVIRVVPRVEREEFINAGVIVFSKQAHFVDCKIKIDPERLQKLYRDADPDLAAANLSAFRAIAVGDTGCRSRIALLDAASRFRWLTARRSTVIQCSAVHTGITKNLDSIVNELFVKVVE